MAARLEFIKLAPEVVLDAGCGQGQDLRRLAKRYPTSRLLAVDFAFEAVRVAARSSGWLQRFRKLISRSSASVVCADLLRLPLEGKRVDLVWSCLALPWIEDPAQAFGEFWRVLRPGGLLAFCTYGPDTLKELRAAFLDGGPQPHVLDFADMHDLGDLMVAAGFSAPVVDVDLLTLTYESVDALARDLKVSGQRFASRPAATLGPHRWKRVVSGYEKLRQNGRLPATVELVFGHAWKPEDRPKMNFKGIEIRRR